MVRNASTGNGSGLSSESSRSIAPMRTIVTGPASSAEAATREARRSRSARTSGIAWHCMHTFPPANPLTGVHLAQQKEPHRGQLPIDAWSGCNAQRARGSSAVSVAIFSRACACWALVRRSAPKALAARTTPEMTSRIENSEIRPPSISSTPASTRSVPKISCTETPAPPDGSGAPRGPSSRSSAWMSSCEWPLAASSRAIESGGKPSAVSFCTSAQGESAPATAAGSAAGSAAPKTCWPNSSAMSARSSPRAASSAFRASTETPSPRLRWTSSNGVSSAITGASPMDALRATSLGIHWQRPWPEACSRDLRP